MHVATAAPIICAATAARVTRDQTMGAYLVDEYAMTEQQVEQQGFNNVLSSAVGARERGRLSELTLEPGDSLCYARTG